MSPSVIKMWLMAEGTGVCLRDDVADARFIEALETIPALQYFEM